MFRMQFFGLSSVGKTFSKLVCVLRLGKCIPTGAWPDPVRRKLPYSIYNTHPPNMSQLDAVQAFTSFPNPKSARDKCLAYKMQNTTWPHMSNIIYNILTDVQNGL